jgi:hypothetical protein
MESLVLSKPIRLLSLDRDQQFRTANFCGVSIKRPERVMIGNMLRCNMQASERIRNIIFAEFIFRAQRTC